MKILNTFRQNDILRGITVNNIIVEKLSKIIPQDEEYLRLIQHHKELSDRIAEAIGGWDYAEKIKEYTEEYTKMIEE